MRHSTAQWAGILWVRYCWQRGQLAELQQRRERGRGYQDPSDSLKTNFLRHRLTNTLARAGQLRWKALGEGNRVALSWVNRLLDLHRNTRGRWVDPIDAPTESR